VVGDGAVCWQALWNRGAIRMNKTHVSIILAAAILTSTTARAGSPVAFKKVEEDTTNELIQVTCSDGKEGFVIKKAGTKEYCTGKDGSGGFCSISKVKASTEVCK
jgi:hypothetical protein